MKQTHLLLLLLLSLGISASAQTAQSDLDMLGLKGSVQNVHIDFDMGGCTWCVDYSFDHKGNLIAVDGLPVVVERDGAARITRCIVSTFDEDGVPFQMVTTYNYDNNRRVTTASRSTDRSNWVETFTYGPDGRLVARSYTSLDGDESYTYVYADAIDALGNWLSRTLQLDDSPELITESRLIEYY